MESKSPPPVELIVTLANNVRIKYPSIEGTYLNPNSESKNQDWKSNPLKINASPEVIVSQWKSCRIIFNSL